VDRQHDRGHYPGSGRGPATDGGHFDNTMGEFLRNLILYLLYKYYIIFPKVSAVASAFVDNIPLTTMMVKITISLAQNSTLNLPLQPLVWALALGACLGGELKWYITTDSR